MPLNLSAAFAGQRWPIAGRAARKQFGFALAGDAALNQFVVARVGKLHLVPFALPADRAHPRGMLADGHQIDDPRFLCLPHALLPVNPHRLSVTVYYTVPPGFCLSGRSLTPPGASASAPAPPCRVQWRACASCTVAMPSCTLVKHMPPFKWRSP